MTRPCSPNPCASTTAWDTRVALLKLIPSLDSGVVDYLAEHYDVLIIESFGVGGLPSYETGDFHSAIERWVSAGRWW